MDIYKFQLTITIEAELILDVLCDALYLLVLSSDLIKEDITTNYKLQTVTALKITNPLSTLSECRQTQNKEMSQ